MFKLSTFLCMIGFFALVCSTTPLAQENKKDADQINEKKVTTKNGNNYSTEAFKKQIDTAIDRSLKGAIQSYKSANNLDGVAETGALAANLQRMKIANQSVNILKNAASQATNSSEKIKLFSQIQFIQTEEAQKAALNLFNTINIKELNRLNASQKLEVADILFRAKGEREAVRNILKQIKLQRLSKDEKVTYYMLDKETDSK